MKMVVEVACYYFPLAKIMDANKDTLVAFSSHFTLTPLEYVRPSLFYAPRPVQLASV